MKQIKSRGITAYQYYPDEAKLRVEWASGLTYDYIGVKPEAVLEMEGSESLGGWAARNLSRGSYTCVPVKGER